MSDQLILKFPFDGSFKLSQKDDNAPFLVDLGVDDIF